jgi:hypothetical protein
VVLALAVLAALAAGGGPAAASPPTAAEVELARTYAPVIRLGLESPRCGDVRLPYVPIEIETIMDDPEVALRGPWDAVNLIEAGPDATTLSRGLWDYHLDFPGATLNPGCQVVRFAQRVQDRAKPRVYARAVTERGKPGRLALQYWFYYLFNEWNNNHEGDWEMIQLNFDAATPAEALRERPTEVGYSQHSSAERAAWGDAKLELVGGTRPVVYPARGSHANFFTDELYLARSQAAGLGCDDARPPWRRLDTRVATVPSEPRAYLPEFPWLGFEGRWGELAPGFFNGPTGPNMKYQWDEPITWADDVWRDESFSVPSSGTVGTAATDFFCAAVGAGSVLLIRALDNPLPVLLALLALVIVVIWAMTRTTWRPSAPLRIGRRRAWGQIVLSSWRMFRAHPRVFLGIGLLFVPIAAVVTGIQALIFRVSGLSVLVDRVGEDNSFVAVAALGLGVIVTLLGFAIVLAATARAMVDIDAGRSTSAIAAYRSVLRDLRYLVRPLAVTVAVQVVLDVTLILIPLALFLLVRWSLQAVVVGVEGGQPRVLRRSARLTGAHWWRSAAIVGGVVGVALLLGPFVGAFILLLTGAAFDFVNLIAAVVYVLVLPIAAIAMTYLYFDLRVRAETEPAGAGEPETLPEELPASA